MTDTTTADNDQLDSNELLSDSAYVITVNGKEVWRSEGQAMLVDRVVVRNARGEVTAIGSANGDTYMEIVVNERSYDAPETYLDMIEQRKRQERQDKYDSSADTSGEGYVAADPETGKPMDSTDGESGIADSGDEESGKPWTTPEEPTEETGPTSGTENDTEDDGPSDAAGDLEF